MLQPSISDDRFCEDLHILMQYVENIFLIVLL